MNKLFLIFCAAILTIISPVLHAAYTGSGWSVAMIDSGIMEDHTSIHSRIRNEACYSRPDIRDSSEEIEDDDFHYEVARTCKNGYGTGNEKSRVPRKKFHWQPEDIRLYHYYGLSHGSDVANVIKNTATSARIDSINASTYSLYDGGGNIKDVCQREDDKHSYYDALTCYTFKDTDIQDALLRINNTSSGVAAVNLSIGGSNTADCSKKLFYKEIQALVDKGIVVVAATGNGSNESNSLPITWPACLSNVIAVAATHYDGGTKKYKVAEYSNTQSGGIYGQLGFFAEGITTKYNNPEYTQGTSFAAPRVAAAFAILKQANPSATVSEMVAALNSNGSRITDKRNQVSAVIINKTTIQAAAAALASVGNVDEEIGFIDIGEYGPAYGDDASENYASEIQFSSATSALAESLIEGDVQVASAAVSLSTKRDVVLTFTGTGRFYIRVNGFTRKDVNRNTNGPYRVTLNRNFFNSGSNTIKIVPVYPSWQIWGIKDVAADYTPSVQLIVGQKKTTQYGYNEAAPRYTGLRANFNLSAVNTDLAFTLIGWDIDVTDETAVYLNKKLMGYLTTGDSSQYTAGDRFVFRKADLATGLNTIEFVQRRPGGSWSGYTDEKWAVKDMLLQELKPDLIISSFDIIDTRLAPNVPFSVSSQVKNTGAGSSSATTVKYYRSTDKTISTSDTEMGTKSLASMLEGQTKTQTISLSSSQVNKTYYIGACVTAVSNEINTQNNCSTGVRLRSRISIAPIIMLLLSD